MKDLRTKIRRLWDELQDARRYGAPDEDRARLRAELKKAENDLAIALQQPEDMFHD